MDWLGKILGVPDIFLSEKGEQGGGIIQVKMGHPVYKLSTNDYTCKQIILKSLRDTARRGTRDAFCCIHMPITLCEPTTCAVSYTHNALSSLAW